MSISIFGKPVCRNEAKKVVGEPQHPSFTTNHEENKTWGDGCGNSGGCSVNCTNSTSCGSSCSGCSTDYAGCWGDTADQSSPLRPQI